MKSTFVFALHFLILATLSAKKSPKKFKFSSDISNSDLLTKYRAYHQKACNSNIKCNNREYFLFKPAAGLGDTINAMEALFHLALKTGNLIYFDWHYFNPDLVFTWKEIHFYQYKVENCDILKECKPLATVTGHVTMDSPVLKLPQVNELPAGFTNSGMVKKYLLQPSDNLKSLIDQQLKKFKCDAALVLRTGQHENVEFLHEHDYEKFVECALKHSPPLNRILVTSDSLEARTKTVKLLESQNREVKTISDSFVHISDLSRKLKLDDRVIKTFLEFHLIGRCQHQFLTQNSLFGSVASQINWDSQNLNQATPETEPYLISHRFCHDHSKMAKKSYVFCSRSKYPEFCSDDNLDQKVEL